MNLNKLIKVADWYLYKENLIRQQVRQAREKRRQFTIYALPGDIRNNPTENTAITHLTEISSIALKNGKVIYFPERWIILFNKLYSEMKGMMLFIAISRYQRKEKYAVTCARLEITPNKYFAILKEIRTIAVIHAVEMDILKTR